MWQEKMVGRQHQCELVTHWLSPAEWEYCYKVWSDFVTQLFSDKYSVVIMPKITLWRVGARAQKILSSNKCLSF